MSTSHSLEVIHVFPIFAAPPYVIMCTEHKLKRKQERLRNEGMWARGGRTLHAPIHKGSNIALQILHNLASFPGRVGNKNLIPRPCGEQEPHSQAVWGTRTSFPGRVGNKNLIPRPCGEQEPHSQAVWGTRTSFPGRVGNKNLIPRPCGEQEPHSQAVWGTRLVFYGEHVFCYAT